MPLMPADSSVDRRRVGRFRVQPDWVNRQELYREQLADLLDGTRPLAYDEDWDALPVMGTYTAIHAAFDIYEGAAPPPLYERFIVAGKPVWMRVVDIEGHGPGRELAEKVMEILFEEIDHEENHFEGSPTGIVITGRWEASKRIVKELLLEKLAGIDR